jgi:cytochrome P450
VADAGGSELREATIKEVQRMRPVIFGAGRFTMKPFALGGYTLPAGTTIALAAIITHYDRRLFDNPREFRPERFIGAKPSPYAFFPFGGGIRRCIGAAFAQMEMDVVLRTLLRLVELVPTETPGERWRFRGVAFAPGDGGLARVRPRSAPEEFRDARLSAAA